MSLWHGESISASELLINIREVCTTYGLYFSNDYNEYDETGKLKSCSIYFSDMPFEDNYSRQISWNLYDEPYNYQTIDFNWDESENQYFKAMVSEDFYENEDLLFKILYGLPKVYPSAKIWIEDNWFYTIEDLEKIKSRPFDDEWCYKNPRDITQD
ncbi:hypothetical protein [Paenibacillus woosongensis]|uniref:Uncharacterized protein n=1 Tax=Paenibacillus woosongensis TaxID=307580 RepID=A0A7X2Z6Z5_9BACL|nr:hypothetical protein [Paenibacillus woosongensis]MUG48128.1 hypothetical protein [Paenibacillus woosongensis]